MTRATSIFSPPHRSAALTILSLVAMSAFEGLAVIAALPAIAATLGHVEQLPWVLSGYMLCSGVATVAAGWLIDVFGVTRVFRGAVILFVGSSLLCGAAPTMETLLAARALQGLGGGAVNAVGLSAIGLVFPRHLVGRAFAANSNVWGAMSVAGPALAALLLTVASWRFIFLVNVPIGGVALWLGWNALPGQRHARVPGESGKLRYAVDLGLITLFSVLALFAILSFDARSLPAAVGALAAGYILMRRGRGRDDALMAPRHAISTPLGPLAWGICALLVGGIGTQTSVPLFASGAYGLSPEQAAWTVIFFVLGWTSGANLSSRLITRWPPPTIVAVSAGLTPTALFAIAAIVLLDGPLLPLAPLLYLAGGGCGLTSNAGVTLVRELVSDDEIGRAVSAHQFVRNLGFAFGNALVGAVLLFVVGRQVGDVEQLRHIGGEGSATVTQLAPEVSAAIGLGFGYGVLASAGVATVGGILLWRLRYRLRDIEVIG